MESTVNPSRYIPSCMDSQLDYMECGNCEIFFTTTNENSGKKFYAMGFSGKGRNSSWHYSFSSKERMFAYIETFVEGCKKTQASKIERKAKQKKMNAEVKCEVGQIFYTSYGYDQTNINYYMITEVKGKTATIVEIGANTVPGSEGFMCCNTTPAKNRICSDPFTKRISSSYNGEPTFKISSFEHAHLTDETTSHYCSWYA